MKMKRNIEFLPNKIKYNAIKKFQNNIIKIPSYVLDEVFAKKLTIEISHEGKVMKTYNYDNLFSYIKKTEDKEYNGKFRNKDIVYTLTHVKV